MTSRRALHLCTYHACSRMLKEKLDVYIHVDVLGVQNIQSLLSVFSWQLSYVHVDGFLDDHAVPDTLVDLNVL